MSGAQLLILVVATALASSLLTLLLGGLLLRHWLLPRLEAMSMALEARVKAGADAAAVEMLPQVRAELVAGFREAAIESLPAFREEVRKGFIEALTVTNAAELLDRTARKVVRTGSSLVESGLNLLRPARPDGTDAPVHGDDLRRP
ncbi:MAG TPA: hypothetical protein PLE42_03225 [Candidatus Competibacteraceae bacterium]|nr:MAG: hypothetical protein EKK69_04070 [Candidatus Competibacteraceae bacterium]HQC71710.1 hypothetical protein [Candidatus Competibacteraceae bacterium]